VPLYLGMWVCRALVPGLFHGQKTLAGRARRRELQERDVVNDR
jgi:hypothetical protein